MAALLGVDGLPPTGQYAPIEFPDFNSEDAEEEHLRNRIFIACGQLQYIYTDLELLVEEFTNRTRWAQLITIDIHAEQQTVRKLVTRSATQKVPDGFEDFVIVVSIDDTNNNILVRKQGNTDRRSWLVLISNEENLNYSVNKYVGNIGAHVGGNVVMNLRPVRSSNGELAQVSMDHGFIYLTNNYQNRLNIRDVFTNNDVIMMCHKMNLAIEPFKAKLAQIEGSIRFIHQDTIDAPEGVPAGTTMRERCRDKVQTLRMRFNDLEETYLNIRKRMVLIEEMTPRAINLNVFPQRYPFL